MKTFSRAILIAVAGYFCAGCASLPQGDPSSNVDNGGVQIRQIGDKLRIEIGGELFSEYHYQDASKPYFYPVLGPGGLPVTRKWPIEQGEGEEHDHPHHRSLWFAHGEINGQDFWSEASKAGRTVHVKFTEIRSGKDSGTIKSLNKLIAADGTLVCTDERTLIVYNRANERLFDFEVTIHASNGDVVFGDTKEGAMAMRLAETMRLKGKVGRGHIVNSLGVTDGDTWGKRASWCDYYGPVDGKTIGVAIFDHPANPRHPTWWHVRDYGLFAANPFGVHDFESKPPQTGAMAIPAGKSLTFRYRVYIHFGDEKAGRVAERYQEYVEARNQKK